MIDRISKLHNAPKMEKLSGGKNVMFDKKQMHIAAIETIPMCDARPLGHHYEFYTKVSWIWAFTAETFWLSGNENWRLDSAFEMKTVAL